MSKYRLNGKDCFLKGYTGYMGYNDDFKENNLVTHSKDEKVTGYKIEATDTNLSTALKLSTTVLFFVLVVASCGNYGYAKDVHPHGELALVGYTYTSAYSPLRAFFMRTISMRSHVMAKLERDTFECAGFLCCLSTNPFQLCHPHLVVNGKAPKQAQGAHTHA